ncbi:TetR-like C-terminal domain-containing protein [Streptomyces sp. DSM 41524]|uniref:TetR-like C-terminal domain-containing protein n=1 Tax=Streptomyces asiaticus subsp. ignotus TaxID=3098222 RepID=A0ABU7QCE2_9ACTN|nr:TetR-like C-terminal domain-containing protein [Streptomyces sp. DSM 41524]
MAVPRAGAFGQPMLGRTEQIVGELEHDGLIDPEGGAQRASLLLWTALHGIVGLRINKDAIDWPDPHRLAEEMIDAIMRPRPCPAGRREH